MSGVSESNSFTATMIDKLLLRFLLMLALTVGFAISAWAQVMLYRGDYVFVLPAVISQEMATLAPRGEWRFFEEHTRYIDPDGDGVDDFVAIEFGVNSGYGAQIRYRLRYESSSPDPVLGRWYWGVITDHQGKKIFEKFNP